MGHARALLGLEGEAQSQAARRVMTRGLSVRETERLVKRLKTQPAASPPSRETRDPDVRRLEEELSGKLGAHVDIQHKAGRWRADGDSLRQSGGVGRDPLEDRLTPSHLALIRPIRRPYTPQLILGAGRQQRNRRKRGTH